MGAQYMYISVFIAELIFLIASTSATWSSPMLVKLNGTDDNPLGYVISKTENSLLASLNIIGSLIGSIIFGMLGQKFGRKSLLTFLGLPLLVFCLVMAWCKVYWLLLSCRFIIGIACGGVFTILPMYCGEIADANNRGILGASLTVFMNVGMLIPYCLGPFIPYFWFHIILAVLPAIYMVLFYVFAPESPYHLIKTDEDAARKVLLKIRSKEKVPQIIEEMKLSMKQTTDVSIMDILRSRGLRKAFIMGLGGFTFQQLTGTIIVATYTQTIFEEAGSGISSDLCPIIVAIAQLIMTIFVSAISDRYPRKFLLSLSHFLVALVQIPFGAYFFLKKHDYDVESVSWLPLVCLIIYVCVYNIGVGPVLVTFLGELFPPRVKGVAISCMLSVNWIGSFFLTSYFNTMNDALGIGVLFWLFSLCSFLAVIFIKFFMIETKGKTLEEIQKELND
ncbi:facilitated trehalose transporter Tret1-like [Coccinella septempunctata]|uniref:facilitated trehalose transporter Tret1-like n=1 Tax=Coccinella septempunctata TaxID=41139 RepID=UPI001D082ECD|nr:facilitated trehalose transporter Tret1-like [Coccinella septempunctata]